MASNALLFLWAVVLLLLVSTQLQPATSTEEETSTDHEKHHHRRRHHHHKKGPSDVPEDSSIKAQIYPPKEAPASDTSHHHEHGECLKLCDGDKGYCRSKDHSKRECERACVHCCDQYKCVPEGKGKCTWDKVWRDNKEIKCP